ncbi:MAG: tRNA (guanine(46)-N(7))-methyltransferase TrmB [Halioglobus sp.]
MEAASRPVSSNQQHMHPALGKTVRKHLAAADQRPVPEHSEAAYTVLREALADTGKPLILDSFCGTGLSTTRLAERFPDSLVVGIDKSANRLAKRPPQAGDNCLLLRAECEDIWRLLARDGFNAHRHFLLYPNPWPKSAHLKRRIHGHPGFRALCALGGEMELRSNWQLYVEEFGAAMLIAGTRGMVARVPEDEPELTLFERKYRRSGHDLWRYRAVTHPLI